MIHASQVMEYCIEQIKEAQKEIEQNQTDRDYWKGRHDAYWAVANYINSQQSDERV